MFWRLLVTVIGGFAAHQLEQPIDVLTGGTRWGRFLRYAVGSLALIPFRHLVFSYLQGRGSKRFDDDLLTADLLTLGGFGTGVLLGHIADGEKNAR